MRASSEHRTGIVGCLGGDKLNGSLYWVLYGEHWDRAIYTLKGKLEKVSVTGPSSLAKACEIAETLSTEQFHKVTVKSLHFLGMKVKLLGHTSTMQT